MGKVAAIQMTSSHVVADNLTAAGKLLREAKDAGADIACLPENFSFIGLRDADKLQVAEPDGTGAVQSFLSDTARELKMWILGGTIVIRGTDRRVANTSLLIDAAGKRVARYDKIHLFDVTIPGRDEQYRESTHVAPGREPVIADTPVGKLGLSVCYDMRFPELYRELVSRGAEWLAMPAAFTVPTGRAHWETLLRARAIENLCYVVAPAQSGTHSSGRETYGDSLIVDYWGQVLSRLSTGTGVITAEFDIAKEAETRARFPALDNRRLGLAPASPPPTATARAPAVVTAVRT
jgi:deaminated glutathione amidase